MTRDLGAQKFRGSGNDAADTVSEAVESPASPHSQLLWELLFNQTISPGRLWTLKPKGTSVRATKTPKSKILSPPDGITKKCFLQCFSFHGPWHHINLVHLGSQEESPMRLTAITPVSPASYRWEGHWPQDGSAISTIKHPDSLQLRTPAWGESKLPSRWMTFPWINRITDREPQHVVF